MGSRRRSTVPPGPRARTVPARSRVTLRRPPSPLPRTATVADALREGRVALSALEGELDAILSALRDPAATPAASAADRLRGLTRLATSALAALTRP